MSEDITLTRWARVFSDRFINNMFPGWVVVYYKSTPNELITWERPRFISDFTYCDLPKAPRYTHPDVHFTDWIRVSDDWFVKHFQEK